MKEVFKHKNFWWVIMAIVILIAVTMFVRWMIKIAPKKSIVDGIRVDTSQLTHPVVQFSLWADQLHVALDGVWTDQNAIEAVMRQLNTRSDWDQLVKTYGVRRLRRFMGMGTRSNGALPTNLRSEMNEKKIERHVNVHLRKFGVSI